MRRVTVLGSCGGFPEPGRACSGFALEWDGLRIVLDLGYDTLPGLLRVWPDGRVDAIVVTHEHPDHCVDLHALFRLHRYSGGASGRIPLYSTPGVLERLAGLEPDVDLSSVFDQHDLPGSFAIGPIRLTAQPVPHFVPAVGVRLEEGGATLAYSGDTGPDRALAELGRDADLYIMEATGRPGEPAQPLRRLMTATEAGIWAARAGARRLMLTHFWPGSDRRAAVEAARAEFGGEVIAAEEGLAVSIRGRPVLPLDPGTSSWCS